MDKVVFENVAPEDKEWTAHIHLLNEWTPQDRLLRHIVQYGRSGKFYPADMHVDLIEQYMAQRDLYVIGEDYEESEGDFSTASMAKAWRNDEHELQRQRLSNLETKE
jgi:hypothetical protein